MKTAETFYVWETQG